MNPSIPNSISQDHFLAIVEALGLSVFIKDADSKLLHINARCAAIWGCKAEELIGTCGEGFFPPDQIAAFVAKDQALFKAGVSEQFDEVFWNAQLQRNRVGRTTKVPTFDANGQPALLFGFTEDITESAEAKKAFQASEQRYTTLVENLQIGVLAQSATDEVLLCNNKALELLGLTKDQLLGKSSMDPEWGVVDEGGIPLPFENHPSVKAARSLEPVRDVILGVNRPRLGGRAWLQVQAEPILNADATLSHVVVSFVDVTELRNARLQAQAQEQALAISNQELERSNVDLQQFAYAASHDLQEPLRSVASCVQMLKKRYGGQLDARADEFMNHAVDGSHRMQNLIDDLLTYSRVSRGLPHKERVSSRQAVDAACLNLKEARQQAAAKITVDELPEVQGNLGQLTQLFQNLVGNALKFRGAQPAVVHISARDAGSEWEFSVADRGIGMEEKYFDLIFQLFQRLHTREEYAGTGIGLTLCQKIVHRHGGRIWLESTLGKGTTFFFTLPKISA